MENIISKFSIKGKAVSIEPYGNGHVNETYKVELDNGDLYILQKINHHVFKDVKNLMKNKELIINHLKEKGIKTLELIKTLDNLSYYYDSKNDSYYRLDRFVFNSISIEQVSSPILFYKTAKAFGNFANALADFDASNLFDVIPNFHNTFDRFNHFLKTLEIDRLDRAKDVKEEIEFVFKHQNRYSVIINLINEGKIPLRVTHNDTKLNNILFDKDTQEPLCIIDLDTIMKGSILYDFGDSIRFGCNRLQEDDNNFTDSIFSVSLFKTYVEGYLSELKDSINEYELKYLAFSSILMTLECGIRFLDDYLDGDRYFKIHYENQNLKRAKNQFRLVKEMEEKEELLNKIVLDTFNKLKDL